MVSEQKFIDRIRVRDNKCLPKPTLTLPDTLPDTIFNFLIIYFYIFIQNKCLSDAIMRSEMGKKKVWQKAGFEPGSIVSKSLWYALYHLHHWNQCLPSIFCSVAQSHIRGVELV